MNNVDLILKNGFKKVKGSKKDFFKKGKMFFEVEGDFIYFSIIDEVFVLQHRLANNGKCFEELMEDLFMVNKCFQRKLKNISTIHANGENPMFWMINNGFKFLASDEEKPNHRTAEITWEENDFNSLSIDVKFDKTGKIKHFVLWIYYGAMHIQFKRLPLKGETLFKMESNLKKEFLTHLKKSISNFSFEEEA